MRKRNKKNIHGFLYGRTEWACTPYRRVEFVESRQENISMLKSIIIHCLIVMVLVFGMKTVSWFLIESDKQIGRAHV